MELNNEALLAAQIKDDEIFELLERLAATEEMFKAPVSTIRDVAELTEASPNLIARILGEIRGPGEFEKLVGRVESHEMRITQNEADISNLKARREGGIKSQEKVIELRRISNSSVIAIVLIIIVILLLRAAAARSALPKDLPTTGGTASKRSLYLRNGAVYEVKGGQEVRVPDDDEDAKSLLLGAEMSENR